MVISFGHSERKMQKSSIENETKQHGCIRPIEPRDRSRIEEIVVSSGRFNQEEIATALELVDEALEKGEESGYIIVVLEVGKEHPAQCRDMFAMVRRHSLRECTICIGLLPIRQPGGRDSDGMCSSMSREI
jgi:hypothetical protein